MIHGVRRIPTLMADDDPGTSGYVTEPLVSEGLFEVMKVVEKYGFGIVELPEGDA